MIIPLAISRFFDRLVFYENLKRGLNLLNPSIDSAQDPEESNPDVLPEDTWDISQPPTCFSNPVESHDRDSKSKVFHCLPQSILQ